MNRRQFLTASAAGLTIGVAGCLGGDGDGEPGQPRIEGEDVTVHPGEETVIEIEASNVGTILYTRLPEPDGLSLKTSETDLSPPSDGGADSDPPHWNWSPTRSTVTVETPLHAAESVAPGEYRYGMKVWNQRYYEDDAEVTTEEYLITVEAV